MTTTHFLRSSKLNEEVSAKYQEEKRLRARVPGQPGQHGRLNSYMDVCPGVHSKPSLPIVANALLQHYFQVQLPQRSPVSGALPAQASCLGAQKEVKPLSMLSMPKGPAHKSTMLCDPTPTSTSSPGTTPAPLTQESVARRGRARVCRSKQQKPNARGAGSRAQ